MKKVEILIDEMQKVKQAHPTLEISEVLRIFNIKSLQELTHAIRMAVNK